MMAVWKSTEKIMETICIAMLSALFALSRLLILGCERLGEKS